MGSLSFVLPAFNEAENIQEAVLRCVAVGERLALEFEVIVVDDGSSDDTRRLADELTAADVRVRTVHHPSNRGYGAALRSGLHAARMDRIFFTDADLQFDVTELDRLLGYADRYAIVAGYRAPRRDPWGRRFLGWTWSRLVGLLFGLRVRDVDCAFKLFDRRVIDAISVESIGAFVNTEILVRALAEGFELVEVPVTHHARVAGEQSGANLRVIFKAVRELISLRGELMRIARTPRRIARSEAPTR